MFTAEFPTVAYAKAFEARLLNSVANGNKDWCKNVVRKGRTVTFEDDIPEGVDIDKATHFMDKLELVGYYGSTQNRKAKLNGIPAPMSY